jgi:hypothetical protein
MLSFSAPLFFVFSKTLRIHAKFNIVLNFSTSPDGNAEDYSCTMNDEEVNEIWRKPPDRWTFTSHGSAFYKQNFSVCFDEFLCRASLNV